MSRAALLHHPSPLPRRPTFNNRMSRHSTQLTTHNHEPRPRLRRRRVRLVDQIQPSTIALRTSRTTNHASCHHASCNRTSTDININRLNFIDFKRGQGQGVGVIGTPRIFVSSFGSSPPPNLQQSHVTQHNSRFTTTSRGQDSDVVVFGSSTKSNLQQSHSAQVAQPTTHHAITHHATEPQRTSTSTA